MKRVTALVSNLLVAALALLSVATAASASTWTLESASTVGMESTGLSAVSCTASTACTAVGSYGYGGYSQPLVERWNGTTWSLQAAPLPGAAVEGGFYGVSCATTTCVAVGWQISSSGQLEMLAELWSDDQWTVTPTAPFLGAKYPELTGVSCNSASSCTAVGFGYNEAYTDAEPIAERWDGSKWIDQVPVSGGSSTELWGVSCPTEAYCMAVGRSFDNAGPATVAEQWTGGELWSLEQTVNPGAHGNTFYGISCTTPSACTAVGVEAGKTKVGGGPLAERWDGSWAQQNVPNSPEDHKNEDQNSPLYSVSCFAETDCFAVGSHAVGEGGVALGSLAEQWGDDEWTLQATADRDELQNMLLGISCTSLASCAVVGSSTDSGDDYPQFQEPLAYPGVLSPVPVAPPSATTGEADGLVTGAELAGIVRDAGRAASWYFEYGSNSSYGSVTPQQTIAGEPEGQHVYARVTSGLYHGVTYHFRLVMVEEGVAHYGEDKTFEGPWEVYAPPLTQSQQKGGEGSGGGTTSIVKTTVAVSQSGLICKVPRLTSLSLTQARRRAKAAHCAVGKVTREKRPNKRKIVISQSPRAGRLDLAGSRIAIHLGAPKRTKAKSRKKRD